MRKGKMVAQGSHASLMAYLKAFSNIQHEWLNNGQTKICVGVNSEEELLNIFKAAELSFPVSLIRDAGNTELPPGTHTAVCIGPAKAEDIDKITGELKLL